MRIDDCSYKNMTSNLENTTYVLSVTTGRTLYMSINKLGKVNFYIYKKMKNHI